MICYLDASALVKRYVAERGSELVQHAVAEARSLGTATISRAEIVAAFAKAVRLGVLVREEGLACRQLFSQEWPHLVRIQVSEAVVDRAAAVAWADNLRGYDAVHLAAAAAWQDWLGEPVTLATFDARLWTAARRNGLSVLPEDALT